MSTCWSLIWWIWAAICCYWRRSCSVSLSLVLWNWKNVLLGLPVSLVILASIIEYSLSLFLHIMRGDSYSSSLALYSF